MRGKRLVLLVLGICFMSLHVWADLPDRKLTLRLNDATMETFLNEVKKQTSINILYNAQMFEDTPTMDVEAQNEPWQKVLQRVLDKHGFEYVIKNDIVEFEDAVKQKKAEIAEAQASVERYKAQLNDVKNNREYDTLSKEIEFQSLEIELCNKKIREANTKVEEKKADLKSTEELIADRRQALEEKKNELDEIMDETRAEEERLKEKAKDLEVKIEPRLLASFKRIRKNARNGLGIVYVQRDACGGCFNKIPPQRQLDIRMHKKIIVCEYCGRILIDPELAGVKTDKPVEEKPKRKRAIRKRVVKKDEDDDFVPEERLS